MENNRHNKSRANQRGEFSMHLFRSIITVAIVASVVLTGQAHGSIIFAHGGSNDPTTEGWQVIPSFAPYGQPSSGPISNDQGSGLDAWFIDDNLTTIGSNWSYTQTPTATQNNQASSIGWMLQANLRVVDAPDSVGTGSVLLEYANGNTDFRLALGATQDGDPIALLWDGGVDTNNVLTGTSFTLTGGGAGYHLYDMIYNPSAGSADLFIDGILRISNYAGAQSTLFDRVAWGSGSSFDTGQSNWNTVQWEITAVPLPAALPLFLSGLAGLGWMTKSRR